ncbi:hypothetical protein [Streptomyces antimicrobicus]|uniref:Uncharacterized protein n=1 Tax=Streptomyces antimicrobicus TaxID=2883108 RepID=A0ABS8BFK2_9ACTN|nr:hypothetical protein [Streptomyces antimicrobicus]MCB5183293.1 hypothetical protein [Streptomyces antimicrobicus]
MRTRLLGFLVAALLAVLAAAAPTVQAADPSPTPTVTSQECTAGGGSVEYDSDKGQWSCIGGEHDGEAVP